MKTTRFAFAITLAAALLCTGCAAALVAGGAAAGAGGMMWYQGRLNTTIGYSMDKTRDAAKSALKRAGDTVVVDEGGNLDRKLSTSLPGGDKVVVDLHSASSTATEITIRIGMLGDRARSQAILDDILARLKAQEK